jgi:uncharacterized protein YcbX
MLLTGLTLYPIKSARGIPLEAWEVDEFGLRHDRRFMVVDRSGEFLSQRDYPGLALVAPAVDGEIMQVSAPGMPLLEVPLAPKPTVMTKATVWDDQCAAAWVGEAAARWFSDLLDCACSLVHMPDSTRRPIDPASDSTGSRVSFADAFPFLIISDASLADLNRRLPVPHPMNRFRPNLTVGGAGAYDEDGWARIEIGEIGLRAVKPCSRCVITTTDQDTMERGLEPLRTLATYRNVGGQVMFGQNAIHDRGGRLVIGDPVVVTRSR